MTERFKKLLDSLDVLSEYDRADYQEIEDPGVEILTEKAVKINGRWIAKSLLRTDMDGRIFVENWLYAKVF